MLRLGIIMAGDTFGDVWRRFGNYDRMFTRALRSLEFHPTIVDAHRGHSLPSPTQLDAIIVSGSPHSVTERAPWADRLVEFSRRAVEARVPYLGVCYGHQLLAHAVGGRVERNPRGYEVGTIEVELTAEGQADPLLGGIGEADEKRLRFNAAHGDAVTTLPSEATLLARNDVAPVQAFRVGTQAWGVQFHPEFEQRVARWYVAARSEAVVDDAHRRGLDPHEHLSRTHRDVKETPAGPALLSRFLDLAGR